MPKELHDKLRRDVNENHPDWPESRKQAYIYGTMAMMGWRRKKKKKKGDS